MAKVKNLFLVLLAIVAVGMLGACSDGNAAWNTPETETYAGTYTIAGTTYTSLNIVSDGTYTMTNGTTIDTGTYTVSAREAISTGSYIFTSRKHSGTFRVTISSDAAVSLTSGTIAVSGSGNYNPFVGNTYVMTAYTLDSTNYLPTWKKEIGGDDIITFTSTRAFTEKFGASGGSRSGTYAMNAKTLNFAMSSSDLRPCSYTDNGKTFTYTTNSYSVTFTQR